MAQKSRVYPARAQPPEPPTTQVPAALRRERALGTFVIADRNAQFLGTGEEGGIDRVGD
jgi:hypothetical protein